MRVSCFGYRPSKEIDFHRPCHSSIRGTATAGTLALLLWLAATVQMTRAQATQNSQNPLESLKQLSLEQLGNVEVTSASKEPEQVWRTPAAIYVITQEDIRRSGASSIPEILLIGTGFDGAGADCGHRGMGVL